MKDEKGQEHYSCLLCIHFIKKYLLSIFSETTIGCIDWYEKNYMIIFEKIVGDLHIFHKLTINVSNYCPLKTENNAFETFSKWRIVCTEICNCICRVNYETPCIRVAHGIPSYLRAYLQSICMQEVRMLRRRRRRCVIFTIIMKCMFLLLRAGRICRCIAPTIVYRVYKFYWKAFEHLFFVLLFLLSLVPPHFVWELVHRYTDEPGSPRRGKNI